MKRNKGFTLIEILVVVAIIGLLSSIVIGYLSSAKAKARLARALTFEKSAISALFGYEGFFFDFEEVSGTTVPDISGFDHPGNKTSEGTLSSDVPPHAINGYSLYLDGTNATRVNIPAPTGGDLDSITDPGSRGYTMSAWFKGSFSSPTQTGYMIYRQGFQNGLGIDVGGNLVSDIKISGGSTLDLNAAEIVNDDEWHYALVSVNNIDKKAYLFLDGALVDEGEYVGDLFNYDSDFIIGGSSAHVFVGYIDNVFISGEPYR